MNSTIMQNDCTNVANTLETNTSLRNKAPPPIARKPNTKQLGLAAANASAPTISKETNVENNHDTSASNSINHPAGATTRKAKPPVKPRTKPATLPNVKLREVLHEVLKTEESYVMKLSLLVAVRINLAQKLKAGVNVGVEERVIDQIIPAVIEPIRRYHATMLLPTFASVYKAMLGVSFQSTLTDVERSVIELAGGTQRTDELTNVSSLLTSSSIGDECTKLSQVFKSNSLHKVIITFYKQFVPEFERVNQQANQCMQNQHFAVAVNEFLKPYKQAPSLAGLSLAHHLLELVQRLPRYPLLLKEYCKCFRPREADGSQTASSVTISQLNASFDEAEYVAASEALELMTESVNKVNASIQEMVCQARLLQLMGAFEGFGEDLIQPGRAFVFEDHSAVKIAARSFKAQTRSLFLFSDLLVLCTADAMRADYYRVHTKLRVFIAATERFAESRMCVIVTPFPSNMESKWSRQVMRQFETGRVIADLCVRVRARERDVILQFDSDKSKSKWVEYFRKVGARICETGDELDDLIPEEERGIRAPTWQDDSDATRCALITCRAPTFTWTNRRHHCRACGRLVCGVCSSKSIRLLYSDKIERVCIDCYEIIDQRSNDCGSRRSSRSANTADASSSSSQPTDSSPQTPQPELTARPLHYSNSRRRSDLPEMHLADYLEVREKSDSCFKDQMYKPKVDFSKFSRAYLAMPIEDIHLLLYAAKNDPLPVRRFPLPGFTMEVEELKASGKAKFKIRLVLPSFSPSLPPKAEMEILFSDVQTFEKWSVAIDGAKQGVPVGSSFAPRPEIRILGDSDSVSSFDSDSTCKSEKDSENHSEAAGALPKDTKCLSISTNDNAFFNASANKEHEEMGHMLAAAVKKRLSSSTSNMYPNNGQQTQSQTQHFSEEQIAVRNENGNGNGNSLLHSVGSELKAKSQSLGPADKPAEETAPVTQLATKSNAELAMAIGGVRKDSVNPLFSRNPLYDSLRKKLSARMTEATTDDDGK